MKTSDLLTVSEVSDLLRIHIRTVQRLSKQGKIKAIKAGNQWRYKKSDIEQYSDLGIDFSKEPIRIPDNFTQPLQEGAGFTERRTFPRINTNFKCRYSINLHPYKEISNEGIIKNLSAGGILLDNRKEQTDKINIDDPIDLKFLLILDNEEKIDISAKGKIIRKAQDGIGIKFKSIDREAQNRIIEYAG